MYKDSSLLNTMRSCKTLLQFVVGQIYDLLRFVRFSAWGSSSADDRARAYFLVKIYHRLEKGMSFPNRRPGSGWKDFAILLRIMQKDFPQERLKYDDLRAYAVMKHFVDQYGHENPEMSERFNSLENPSVYHQECLEVDSSAVREVESLENVCVATDPETFFESRYSTRHFSDWVASREIIFKILRMATKAPSVCNRQAWHIYVSTDKQLVQRALKYQNGNRGFGHQVRNLFIVCSDLKAFDSSAERYQHWIDGGIFSMALVNAIHSLGLVSCCLNWGVNAGQDKRFRKVFDISPEHSVIMFMAFGKPLSKYRVCASVRRPVGDFMTVLSER